MKHKLMAALAALLMMLVPLCGTLFTCSGCSAWDSMGDSGQVAILRTAGFAAGLAAREVIGDNTEALTAAVTVADICKQITYVGTNGTIDVVATAGPIIKSKLTELQGSGKLDPRYSQLIYDSSLVALTTASEILSSPKYKDNAVLYLKLSNGFWDTFSQAVGPGISVQSAAADYDPAELAQWLNHVRAKHEVYRAARASGARPATVGSGKSESK